MEPMFLKCYIERKSDGWRGICVDLDIAVQGDSYDEVVSSLKDGIEVYYETVMSLPEADRKRLLHRPVPLERV